MIETKAQLFGNLLMGGILMLIIGVCIYILKGGVDHHMGKRYDRKDDEK